VQLAQQDEMTFAMLSVKSNSEILTQKTIAILDLRSVQKGLVNEKKNRVQAEGSFEQSSARASSSSGQWPPNFKVPSATENSLNLALRLVDLGARLALSDRRPTRRRPGAVKNKAERLMAR